MVKAYGILMQCDIPNEAGRVYSSEAVKSWLESYKDEPIFGKFGQTYPVSKICEMSEITHRVSEINFDDTKGQLTGTIELLDTPNGRIAQNILEHRGSIDIVPIVSRDPETGKFDIIRFDLGRESVFNFPKVHKTNK